MKEQEKWLRLFNYLDENNSDLDLYVYRIDSRGRRQKPNIWHTFPHSGLLETLRDEHGGGQFYIMIRDGSTMVFSGKFAVEGIRYRPRSQPW